MRQNGFSRILACTLAASCVWVVPAMADVLVGRILSVDVEAKTLIVKEKDTDKETEVTVTDETVIDNGKAKPRVIDLEKFQKNVARAKKGVQATIIHEKGVASRIVRKANTAPKKDEPKEEPKETPKS